MGANEVKMASEPAGESLYDLSGYLEIKGMAACGRSKGFGSAKGGVEGEDVDEVARSAVDSVDVLSGGKDEILVN